MTKRNQADYEKARQMVLYFCRKSKSDPKFGSVKLAKQMFYSDFLAYKQFGSAISRAVFVPMASRGLPRLWTRSGIFEGAHVQLCVREPNNILAVWSVRKDGRYGKDA